MTELEALIIGLVLIAYGYVAAYWSMDLFVESGRPYFECDFSLSSQPMTNHDVRHGAWVMLFIALSCLLGGLAVARYTPY